eukprot:COSAG06_NODE_312_length_17767_cov_17.644895_9_plen_56_part_00
MLCRSSSWASLPPLTLVMLRTPLQLSLGPRSKAVKRARDERRVPKQAINLLLSTR